MYGVSALSTCQVALSVLAPFLGIAWVDIKSTGTDVTIQSAARFRLLPSKCVGVDSECRMTTTQGVSQVVAYFTYSSSITSSWEQSPLAETLAVASVSSFSGRIPLRHQRRSSSKVWR